MNYKIAICLTVHNRNDTAKISYENWVKFKPSNAEIFVIDDSSIIPFEYATHRTREKLGIAKSKNVCIACADGFDYIVLADDDIFPLKTDWHLPYIESGLNHACYTFGRQVLDIKPSYIEYEKPNGCLLFLTRKAIDTVGGFDEDFKIWGFEHVNYSDRIYNNGLTPARYIDVINSTGLFHSMDEHHEILSSVHAVDRLKGIHHNQKLYKEKYLSTEFKPYK